MKTFTIENETNNITLHASAKEAEAVPNVELFDSEASLWKVAENWPAARLMEVWNSLPGVTPVKKFKDRASTVSRIWKALQNLGEAAPVTVSEPQAAPLIAMPFHEVIVSAVEATPPVTETVISQSLEADVPAPVPPQTPHVATEVAPTNNKATRAKKAADGATTKEPGAPRGPKDRRRSKAEASTGNTERSESVFLAGRLTTLNRQERHADMGELKQRPRAVDI